MKPYVRPEEIFHLRKGLRHPRPGMRLGLAVIAEFLQALGNPQEAQPTVLIGGSNGKGSTGAYLSALLTGTGIRNGWFSSPHLISFTERFCINGRSIENEVLGNYLYRLRKEADSRQLDLTFFEFATALAFSYFRDAKVQVAINEVGLGGRLDATNCGRKDLCLLTDISQEHTQYLGNSVAEIAREKAAIIPERGVVFTSNQTGPAREVIGEFAEKQQAKLAVLGEDFELVGVSENQFRFEMEDVRWQPIVLPVAVEVQRRNLALALAAFVSLNRQGIGAEDLPEGSLIQSVVRSVQVKGRYQILRRKPLILVDGAHNPAAFQALFVQIERNGSIAAPVHLVVAVKKDKNLARMAQAISGVQKIYCTDLAPHTDLGRETFWSAEEIKNECIAQGVTDETRIQCFTRPTEAIAAAVADAAPTGSVVVSGSFYLAGEALTLFPGNGDPRPGERVQPS